MTHFDPLDPSDP